MGLEGETPDPGGEKRREGGETNKRGGHGRFGERGTNSESRSEARSEVSQDGEESGRGYIGGGDVSPTPSLGRFWAGNKRRVRRLSETSSDEWGSVIETDGARSLNSDGTGGEKRGRSEKRVRDNLESEGEGETPVRKVSTSRRGRGKGHYTGLCAAKKQLENYETETETDAPYSPKPKRNSGRRSQSPMDADENPAGFETPGSRIKACAQEIMKGAAKSKNLKGEIWGQINSACRELINLAESLGESEVVRALKADNERMRSELENLRLETKALRKAFSERKKTTEPAQGRADTHTLLEELGNLMDVRLGNFRSEIFKSLGNMVNARLESVEGRLPPEPIRRPPLAADRRRIRESQDLEMDVETMAHQVDEPSAPRPEKRNRGASLAVSQTAANQPAGEAPRAAVRPQLSQAQPRPVPTPRDKKLVVPAPRVPRKQARPGVPPPAPPAPPQNEWTTVVKKGKGKAKGKSPASPQTQQQQTPKKKTAPKLVAPTMAAVVVALKPDSQTDYRTVMERATTLKLAELGVDHLNVRKTATGARIIEVPGAQSSQAADNLTDRLRNLIGDVADVYRPIKKAEIKISGFDESVTPEILKKEVAARGNCQVEQVTVGAIRMAANGTGSVIIRCPLSTAKVVVTTGRIVIGWSAARVEALEQLPLRCYRCMGTGHTRPLCPSSVDRSDWCYRCSKPGHKSHDCTALAPWCAVCHHAGLKAGHVMGGQACTPPPVKGKEAYRTGPANAAATAPRNVPNRTERQPMET
ncbi:uncharacterized protein LOC133521015 [Cydia pomonella]|uniref:uncharacterized protein LOC133521015 n=1 Tax=Cydia pomonella TaxID=82600 RepID=UPI002ADE6614|nr:uncharacterized protein LOC133521015 [Cydia pomonella]